MPNTIAHRIFAVVIVTLCAASSAVAQTPATTKHGMFNDKQEVIGGIDVMRCDELKKFDDVFGVHADSVLGAYGLGYITGGFEQLVAWLQTDPSTAVEQAQAKAMRAGWDAFPLTLGIVEANVRAFCSDSADGTFIQAVRKLFRQATK